MRPAYVLAAVMGLAAAVCSASACLWLVAPREHGASLVRMDIPNLSSTNCLPSGSFGSGPTLNFTTEWVTSSELVGVLSDLIRQGWQPINHMSTSIELLPARQTTIDLWLFRMRMLRAVSLSYTDESATRLVASTSVVLCPP